MASTEAVRATKNSFGQSAARAGTAFFAVIIIISQFLLPDSPNASDSSQKISSYLALRRGQLQANAVLAGLAASAATTAVDRDAADHLTGSPGTADSGGA